MCGILGCVGNYNYEIFAGALNRMAHRGPDGFGIWQNPEVILGHRRLSIIDLSENAHQPMEFGDRYIITLNGEIYNYLEIRSQLISHGVNFKSNSDTEVLLHSYIIWGADCLNKLNGMWSFAIWDKKENTLFLSRDRLGKKPLFYSTVNESFLFSSEMKGIYPFLESIETNDDIVNIAIGNSFKYESTEHCLIKNIKRFPAGCYALYSVDKGLEIKKYWNPLEQIIDVPKKYFEQTEMFRYLFLDSCKLRMRSDVTIGTALSGGLDSSAVICSMAHVDKKQNDDLQKNWQHAFIASFPGTSLDETEYAKEVVDFLNIKANFVPIDPLLELDDLYHQTYLFEEIYYAPTIPFVQLYRNIKQNNVTVSIDGHGADELFAGYPFDMVNAIPDSLPNLLKFRHVVKTINSASSKELNNHEVYNLFKYGLLNKFHFLNNFSKNKQTTKLLHKYNELGFLNSTLFDSTYLTILPTLLRNYDRYSMINGVEIRMPFLDYRLLQFAFSIPYSSKIRNGYGKAIIRDALKDIMPRKITERKSKIGFNSPMHSWMNGKMKTWVYDTIHSQSFNQATFINSAEVKKEILEIINKQNISYIEGESAFSKLIPYIWEKSLQYAR